MDNKDLKDYLMNKTIVNMYNAGYSINFISKKYYKYKNKNQKPIKIEGNIYFPPKIYNMDYCKLYVSEVIYDYCKEEYAKTSIS